MPRHTTTRRVPFGVHNFLSVIEGIEGGFAIFAGIVVGLSFEGVSRELLIITAAIGIIVNAFNASAVRYTSEHFIDELDGHEHRSWLKAYLIPALTEFLIYGLVSVIAIIPLLFISDYVSALITMVVLTLVMLFVAGWYRGRVLYGHTWRDGLEVLISGGLIIAVGALAGWILSSFIA